MRSRTVCGLLVAAAIPSLGAVRPLGQQFDETVRPYVTKYCVGCHSGKSPAAQFDMKSYTTMDAVTREFPRWALVTERLTAKEMPPKPMPAPPSDATQQIMDWIHAVRAEQIKKSAGDPGVVLARRLSNAEYNYTVRDLTGQDMQVAASFRSTRRTRQASTIPANR